jgi:hypothetical protein
MFTSELMLSLYFKFTSNTDCLSVKKAICYLLIAFTVDYLEIKKKDGSNPIF